VTKNNWFAAYAYWYLKIYGHDDVRVLDGGRQKWIDEGRELTTDAPSREQTEYAAKERDETLRARRDKVKEGIGAEDKALVDVRSPQEYSASSSRRRATSRRVRSAAVTSRQHSRSRGRRPFATTARSGRSMSCASCTGQRA
jgi:3-mercaptopyruvate sulfurtransferase SseA